MVLALVVAGFTVVGGGQALASDVGCGDTITTDTTLDSDLVNCPNNGIIIGADNITLDLNGHTIDGDGAPVDPCSEGEPCDIGVLNVAGHDRLSIVGGTVQQFGVGVLVEGAAHPRLHQLAASDNTDFGIIVAGSTDPVIEQTSMSDNGTSGLVLVESRGALVARNTVSGSNGYAIFTTVVDDSRIQNNALDGNDHGIAVFDRGSRNLIQRNVVSHGSGSTIDLGGGAGNRIERNRLIDTGDGIIAVDVQDTLISRNLLTDTGSSTTPEQSGGFGILVDGGARATVDGTSSPAGGVRLSSCRCWRRRPLRRTPSSHATSSPATRPTGSWSTAGRPGPCWSATWPAVTATTASTSTSLPPP